MLIIEVQMVMLKLLVSMNMAVHEDPVIESAGVRRTELSERSFDGRIRTGTLCARIHEPDQAVEPAQEIAFCSGFPWLFMPQQWQARKKLSGDPLEQHESSRRRAEPDRRGSGFRSASPGQLAGNLPSSPICTTNT